MAFNGTGSNVTSLNASNIASGTLAVARGGTGTASPSLVAGSGISVSGTWPNQTVAAAGGGVTSLNGQTGAITNTDYNSIGSYVIAYDTTFQIYNSSAKILPNTTIAGSNLSRTLSEGSSDLYNIDSNLTSNGLSGTWRRMSGLSGGAFGQSPQRSNALFVRIS
jgi:hypothetical protein